jgi:SOS response regulatory protein OraA/RecX
MIKRALSCLDASNQTTTIEILLQKKSKLIKAKSLGDMYAKLVRFGVSRGYQYETVANIAETVSRNIMHY